MKIRSLMVPDPITITKRTTVTEAIELMKHNSIRHLPVISAQNHLEGFVTLADMKQGLIPSMVGDLTLEDLMIKDPISVGPDDDIEIGAQFIYKYKIGGMPVVRDGRLVGIITATDMLRTFIDMMGMLSASSRVDVEIEEKPGAFKKATQIIHDSGGDIINVGMTTRSAGKRTYYFRLTSCKTGGIRKSLEDEGFTVVSAMD
ncbi:MAG TPA: CBS domain-containing protein [Chromatiaceae bacterium]|nr:CBS domain-containing protein [Chromatiaceae bacterium]